MNIIQPYKKELLSYANLEEPGGNNSKSNNPGR